jgi:hypothetical protein
MTHHRLRLIRLFARARRPEDTLLASSIRALFERADDRTHGITNISGPPYNDITIQYTVYKPATVSEQINAVADAAAKTGELVTARALNLKDRKTRILPNKGDAYINTFVVWWPAAEVLRAAKKPDGRATLTRTARLEEIWGSYWTIVCSNLPPPELFTSGGEIADRLH